jgi:hypothetical protein
MLKNGGVESSMLKLMQTKKGMFKKIQHVEKKSSMLKKTACASTEVFADEPCALGTPVPATLLEIFRQVCKV